MIISLLGHKTETPLSFFSQFFFMSKFTPKNSVAKSIARIPLNFSSPNFATGASVCFKNQDILKPGNTNTFKGDEWI